METSQRVLLYYKQYKRQFFASDKKIKSLSNMQERAQTLKEQGYGTPPPLFVSMKTTLSHDFLPVRKPKP